MTALGDWLHERLDPIEGHRRPRHARAGVGVLVVLALLLVVAYGGWRPWTSEGPRVRATFVSADQLVDGRTPVRVAGVEVGTVDHLEPGPGGRGTTVVMSIDDRDVHVARDATAHIRLRTVLSGTRFVDLEPGSPSAPALGHATIPASRTTVPVDWDDVNDIYSGDARQGLRNTLRGLRKGLSDAPSAAATIDVTGPALSTIGDGVAALRGQRPGDLPRLVRATDRVLAALARQRSSLEALVHDGAHTSGVTASHRNALGRAVALTPDALNATTTTMRRLRRTLEHLDPVVEELRPGARQLGPALTGLRPGLTATDRLLRGARPLLGDLRPALRHVGALADDAHPLVKGLEPTVDRINDRLVPWLQERDDDIRLRNFEAIGPLFSILAAPNFDRNGWFFHFPVPPSPESVVLPCAPTLTPGQLQRCELVNSTLDKVLGPDSPPRAGRRKGRRP